MGPDPTDVNPTASQDQPPPEVDLLTGVLSRAIFKGGLELSRPLGVILLDLDGFIYVNDVYGHHVGDEVLREVARRLGAALAPEWLLVRLGGDEFVALLQGVGDIAQIQDTATRLLRAFDLPVQVGAHPIDQRASVGITISTSPNIMEALAAADAAMFEAKRRGRSRAVGLDPEWEAS